MKQQVVSIEDLTFTYQQSIIPALKDINLHIEPGEFVTITGPSGCGKSTLALCLAGFVPHSVAGQMSGSVVINGMDTRTYSPAKLAGSVGLVQQDPEAQLCTLKVIDEVAFGPENLCLPPGEIKERVQWALKAVNSLHLINREVYSLSGGEKQRVAIASILAMKPAVIILDEPTANLDPGSTLEVLQVIENLKREKAASVIVIEHRLKRLLPLSDRLIVMEKGRIAADGNPQEVYRDHINQRSDNFFTCPEQSICRPSDTQPLLQVENMSVGYGSRIVLNEVSFNIFPGEITAIMGNNGSGKTSLLLSLLGINKLKRGKVYLKGRDITSKRVAERARSMGLIFQNPSHQIFENTVFKEAHLPSSLLLNGKSNHSHTESLLTEFDLISYKEQLPFALSLGEKKRLTLVSVLGYQPEILILDEPLVGQDEYRLNLFWQAIKAHSRKGGATIMVCHEPDFVQAFCDKIIFLDQGKLMVNAPTQIAFSQLKQLNFPEYLPS